MAYPMTENNDTEVRTGASRYEVLLMPFGQISFPEKVLVLTHTTLIDT
jgi:hypothetical protein